MIQASRRQWIKFGIVLLFYIAFLIWLKSWLGIIVISYYIFYFKFQGGYYQAMDNSDNDANPDNADNKFNLNIY